MLSTAELFLQLFVCFYVVSLELLVILLPLSSVGNTLVSLLWLPRPNVSDLDLVNTSLDLSWEEV